MSSTKSVHDLGDPIHTSSVRYSDYSLKHIAADAGVGVGVLIIKPKQLELLERILRRDEMLERKQRKALTARA